VTTAGTTVIVQVLDSLRKRVYVAPLGLYLTLDAGTFESVTVDTRTNAVRVTLAPASADTPRARLRVEQPFRPAGAGTYAAATGTLERGAYTIALGASPTRVEIRN
jgi:hypothetical protein